MQPKLIIAVILVSSLLARVAVVLSTSPVLSDDIWRYLHDGGRLLLGENPYAHAPAELVKLDTHRINHPELVTIYQPTSQWMFAFCRWVVQWHVPWTGRDPQGLDVFRLMMVLFDVWIIALILLKLLGAARSPWWAALYAWHPLVIAEVAWSGHQDVIGITWLLMTLTMADWLREKKIAGWRALLVAVGAGGALALAIGVKPLVAPIALAFILVLRTRPAALLSAAATCAVTLALLYLPFAFMPGGLERMFETVATFTAHWRFNGSLHPLTEWVTGRKVAADALMAGMLLGVIAWGLWRRLDPWRFALVYFFAALLLSSTVHPWYLLWALALLPMRFNLALATFSVTIGLSYMALLRPDYRVPLGLLLLEYVPVYAVLIVQAWPRRGVTASP